MIQGQISPSLVVSKLHYKILKKLAELLDIPGEHDWNALIAELPPEKYRFSLGQISKLNMAFQRPGGSASLSLLTDLGQQLMKVGELTTYLEAINNQEALELVKPHEPVRITRNPVSITTQAGQSVVLSCEASGFPQPVYQWFKNDNNIDVSSSELKLKNVTEDTSGNYHCKVTNAIGSEFTSVAQVQVTPSYVHTVYHPEVPQFYHPVPPDHGSSGYTEHTIPLYVGQSFSLTCDKPAHTYQWYRNSYPIPGACRGNLYFHSFLPADEGYYSCLINDGRQQIFTELAYLKCKDIPGIGDAPTNKEFATGKLALIIANQEYYNPRHPGKLIHPIDDAKLLQEKLESIGFKVFSFSNLSRKEMKAAVRGFCRILTCSQELYSLIYFCGHGFEEHGKTYLVPVDVDLEWTCHSAISAEEILSDIQQQGTTKLDVLLLDVCRTPEPNGSESYGSVNPPFKAGAQCVFGYATCPQSQSFEVRQHRNGLYMKHLASHITENIQIEHMLHKVGVAVREEAERSSKTDKMSPTFNSTTTKVFSLCDNVLPAGFIPGERDPEVEWFQYHRLPAPRTISFDYDIKVEMKFLREPGQVSNACNIVVFVVDMGSTLYCDAKFCEDGSVLSKCLQLDSFETATSGERSSEFERWSEVPALQKLYRPLEITVEVEFQLDRVSPVQRMRKCMEFQLHEFGVIPFFDMPPQHLMSVSSSNQMVFVDDGLQAFHL